MTERYDDEEEQQEEEQEQPDEVFENVSAGEVVFDLTASSSTTPTRLRVWVNRKEKRIWFEARVDGEEGEVALDVKVAPNKNPKFSTTVFLLPHAANGSLACMLACGIGTLSKKVLSCVFKHGRDIDQIAACLERDGHDVAADVLTCVAACAITHP